MAAIPVVKALRADKTKNAIVFVHGFGGDPEETWGSFPGFLMANPALREWNVYSVGYLTQLAPDFKGAWKGNPSIREIASFLYTQAYAGQFQRYEALVFIAHSMGGLVVQRALLDYADLLGRTTHVFLFGTPSAGLKKAGWFKWFKRQIGDMVYGGEFIAKLRDDWKQSWPTKPPPRFWAIAGDSDEFVPASTSLGPFPTEQRLVVPGNHSEIVKPADDNHLSPQVVVRGLQDEAAPGGPWNSARVALEMLDFRKAVEILKPHADKLDEAHLVQLAMALEGLGESEKALDVLRKATPRGTDARGVLAGRFKRRWLAGGRQDDYERALELYSGAFAEAASDAHHAQAYYHGINVCFLNAAMSEGKADISETAEAVLDHCRRAERDFWCLGTEGEARLCLGDEAKALASYRAAVEDNPKAKPWQLKSMHSQACQLAAILNRDELIDEIDRIFRPHVESS